MLPLKSSIFFSYVTVEMNERYVQELDSSPAQAVTCLTVLSVKAYVGIKTVYDLFTGSWFVFNECIIRELANAWNIIWIQ